MHDVNGKFIGYWGGNIGQLLDLFVKQIPETEGSPWGGDLLSQVRIEGTERGSATLESRATHH